MVKRLLNFNIIKSKAMFFPRLTKDFPTYLNLNDNDMNTFKWAVQA